MITTSETFQLFIWASRNIFLNRFRNRNDEANITRKNVVFVCMMIERIIIDTQYVSPKVKPVNEHRHTYTHTHTRYSPVIFAKVN